MDFNTTTTEGTPRDTSNNQVPIITAWVIMTVLAGVTVAMRFYTRRLILHILGPEDWLILFSMVCSRPASARFESPLTVLVVVQVLAVGTCVGFVRRKSTPCPRGQTRFQAHPQ